MSFVVSYFAGAGDQFFTDDGVPLNGGLIYTYAAGTTTPAVTYTSNTGAVANTNPIVLNSAGRTPYDIWVDSGTYYKFVLKTSVGVTIGTYDNMPGVGDPDLVNNLITVTGTNTLIGTAVIPYLSYVTGMELSFEAVATNTTAMTINVDGLGAKDITLDGTLAIPAGAVTNGRIINIVYDGLVFQASNVLSGDLLPNNSISAGKLDTDLINQFTTVTPDPADHIAISDASDSNANKKALISAVPGCFTAVAPATGDYLTGADTSDSGIGKKFLVSDLLALVPAAASFATSAEAQALSSNTVVISPLSLKQAFQGSNQSLAASGYQKLPGGVIIQWGTFTVNGTGVAVTLPVTFPSLCSYAAAGSNTAVAEGFLPNTTRTTSTVSFYYGAYSTSFTAQFIAIGY